MNFQHALIKAIEQVPWAHLAHAYNSAIDVPAHLRQIITPSSQDDLDDAIDWFWGAVLHQGSVYSASIPSVWILLKLIESEPNHPAVASILAFIGSIAELNWDFDVEDAIPIQTHALGEPPYAVYVDDPLPVEFEDDEESYFQACYVSAKPVKQLCLDAIPIVASYIHSADKNIQKEMVATSLNLLTLLPNQAKSLNVIFSIIGNEDYDPSVWVHIGRQATSKQAIASWLNSQDRRLNVIAALNPLSEYKTSLPILATNLTEHEWIDNAFPNFVGNLHFWILFALLERTCANTAPTFVIDAIIALIEKRASMPNGSRSMLSADSEVKPILEWAFIERITEPPYKKNVPLPNQLTVIQQKIIQTLCSNENIWHATDGNMSFAYQSVQLPYNRKKLSTLTFNLTKHQF